MPRGNHIVCSFNRHVRFVSMLFMCIHVYWEKGTYVVFHVFFVDLYEETSFFSPYVFHMFFHFNPSNSCLVKRPGSAMPCGWRCRIALMFACPGHRGTGAPGGRRFGERKFAGWFWVGKIPWMKTGGSTMSMDLPPNLVRYTNPWGFFLMYMANML